MRIAALCGSLRRGSYNQALLNAAIERGGRFGLEIVQAPIDAFPLFSQDRELQPPAEVLAAKELVRSACLLLLVSPEANYGVPGVLKNAIDWLSRPKGDPTLFGRPMAVMGASTGRMGTVRAQMAWRQLWLFFHADVFTDVELTVPFAASLVDASGRLTDAETLERLDQFLAALGPWAEEHPPRKEAAS
jgi:chromate reductase